MPGKREGINAMKYKAYCGISTLNGPDGNPILKTEAGWRSWADREAAKSSRHDKVIWVSSVIWVESRKAFRILFFSQKENWIC